MSSSAEDSAPPSNRAEPEPLGAEETEHPQKETVSVTEHLEDLLRRRPASAVSSITPKQSDLLRNLSRQLNLEFAEVMQNIGDRRQASVAIELLLATKKTQHHSLGSSSS